VLQELCIDASKRVVVLNAVVCECCTCSIQGSTIY
jgi:hypothetical protein